MNVPDLAALVLSAMRALEPSSPYAPTFETTAYVVAAESEASPLFAGADGGARTAALLTSLAWFESRFRPDAEGDHGRSVCLVQIHESNHRALGVTREELRSDVETCVRAGLRMTRQSMTICRSRPLDERLSWYAQGGRSCAESSEDALRKSRHRMAKARWIYDRFFVGPAAIADQAISGPK